MSLVNDMLRDLEARRAAPGERQELGAMHAVDEAGARRRERFERLRRGAILLAAVVLVGIPLGLFIEKLIRPETPTVSPLFETATEAEAETAAEPVAPVTHLLDVLPQHDGQRFVLQLLLDRSVSYQRTDQGGAVSLRLSNVQLIGAARSGRIERDGRSLSWRVEEQGEQVDVLLIGMADRLQVHDRLEPAGDRWQLWLEVPLTDGDSPAPPALQDLPVAEPAMDETQLPEWVTRTVPAESPAEQRVAPEIVREAVVEDKKAQALAELLSTPPQQPKVQIGSHQPDPLSQARQLLVQQQYPQAITELQTLHKAQPNNPEVTRWLARGYLSAGETDTLLAWLPAQVQARPFDAELRVLLARGQLQNGDSATAIATLEQQPPDLQRDPAYFALLAAAHQQVGDWASSAAVYRQLVAFNPRQATWQLGLAIALEQLNQPVLAGRHYRLAVQGQGLDESAERFAIDRAGALGGKQ